MKVSSKIILGFLVLMVLAIIVVINQLSAIHQIRSANQDLSEINVKSATIVQEMQKSIDLLGDDSRKYFVVNDPLQYEQQIALLREEFVDHVARLRLNVKSPREEAELANLEQALNDFWAVFNRLKKQKQTWADDPPDLTVAVNHLDKQAEIM